MIAGTLALLREPADAPLADYHDGGYSALDVESTQEYLDGRRVQEGMAASQVETRLQKVHLDGSDIETSREQVLQTVATNWVADVTTETPWVVAESTTPGPEPPFPFDLISARTGTIAEPVELDPAQFVANQLDAGNDLQTEMLAHESANEKNTTMDYGQPPGAKRAARDANIGVGFKTPWRSTVVRGIIYGSGYLAVYAPSSWGSAQFARFVDEEIVPIASVPEADEDAQQTLGESGSDEEVSA